MTLRCLALLFIGFLFAPSAYSETKPQGSFSVVGGIRRNTGDLYKTSTSIAGELNINLPLYETDGLFNAESSFYAQLLLSDGTANATPSQFPFTPNEKLTESDLGTGVQECFWADSVLHPCGYIGVSIVSISSNDSKNSQQYGIAKWGLKARSVLFHKALLELAVEGPASHFRSEVAGKTSDAHWYSVCLA